MKKEIVKYFLVAGLALLTACSSNDDFLKENLDGKIFPESFYHNKDELEMANNAIYNWINRSFHSYYTTMMIGFFAADDVTTPYSGNASFVLYDTFIPQAADIEGLQGGWEKAYLVINAANGVIENYKRAEGAVGETELHYYAGQAYFARAYMYYWLVRCFNEIPYITTARVPDRTIVPLQPAELYTHIIEDLQIAEEWLPQTWNGIDALKHSGGAFTKGAAKATLASVYLTMAGYPVKKTECYALAAAKAKELIDNESSYGYRLLDHYAELWKSTPLICDEDIFVVLYNKNNNYTCCAPKACRPIQFGGWEQYTPEINFFNRFPAGERFDATFVTEFPLNSGFYTESPVLPWPEGKPMVKWQDMMFGHPYYYKMWEADFSEGADRWRALTDSEWRCSRSNHMIRYAEVLLIYAEAQAMAENGPNALAYNCINRVRNRAFAGVGSTQKNLQPGLSATAFRDSVFVERGWEFAGFEICSRWFDLVRMELVEDAVKEKPDHSFLPGRSPKEWPIANPPTKRRYFLPIPADDALLNPNLAKD